MLKGDFYHELTKKYTVLFGTLFNSIYISRFDEQDKTYSKMKVPIAYGSIEKHLARTDRLEKEKGRNYAISFPRISFEVENILYATDRKTNRLNQIFTADSQKKIGSPVPYDINISFTVAANRTEDGYQIVEQILPIFNPEFNVTAKLIDEFPDLKLDIPIVLNSVSPQMDYEGPFEDRRILRWNLDFTIRGYFFSNTSESNVIKIVKTNLITDWESGQPIERVTVYPGVDGNGNPTTVDSEAIPYWLVEKSDNYDYVVNIDTLDEIGFPSSNVGYIEETSDNNTFPYEFSLLVDFSNLQDGSILEYDSSINMFRVTTLLAKQTINCGHY